MFSPETPAPVTTTRWATGEIPFSPVYGAKPAFPQKPYWTPHGSSLLMDPCRNDYSVRTWTPSSSADGNPGSRPNPKASTEPRRAPQTLPQMRRTLQGDGNMPTQG
jgi:hypothetical protein